MASVVRIGAHVRAVIDPDGAVILDLKHGRYFSLNRAGVAVWSRLVVGMTPLAIGTEFAAHYPTTDGIENDVAVFIESLRRAELVDGRE